jgi:hypothetical protein
MLVSSRASSCTALGRPRSHHECPPEPVTVSRTRGDLTASVNTFRTVTCQRQHRLGRQLAAGMAGAAQPAEPLLADGEHDGQRLLQPVDAHPLVAGAAGQLRQRHGIRDDYPGVASRVSHVTLARQISYNTPTDSAYHLIRLLV